MVTRQLRHRKRVPLDTSSLSSFTGDLSVKQGNNLFHSANLADDKNLAIRNLDQLFHECTRCFDPEESFETRSKLGKSICSAMGIDNSIKNLIEIRNMAVKYVTSGYFSSETGRELYKRAMGPVMDANERIALGESRGYYIKKQKFPEYSHKSSNAIYMN